MAVARTALPRALREVLRLQSELADLKVVLDHHHGLAFAATNPANWQKRDTPEERIKCYEDTLVTIENGEYFWTAEHQIAMAREAVEMAAQADMDELRTENARLRRALDAAGIMVGSNG